MKKLSDGEKIFLIYSVVNLIVLYHGIKGIGILNEDIAFGMVISFLIFLYSYLLYGFYKSIKE